MYQAGIKYNQFSKWKGAPPGGYTVLYEFRLSGGFKSLG
jgi:hypothetical protein